MGKKDSRQLGSPPQVRGKHYRARRARQRSGITPAGAGKTILCRRVTVGYEDHPRRCGENFAAFLSAARTSGSPPQVRGKPVKTITFTRHFRITPAGAGKTVLYINFACGARDHPRRCGENRSFNAMYFSNIGSPPQVRGKLDTADDAPSHERITPAGAGKT